MNQNGWRMNQLRFNICLITRTLCTKCLIDEETYESMKTSEMWQKAWKYINEHDPIIYNVTALLHNPAVALARGMMVYYTYPEGDKK